MATRYKVVLRNQSGEIVAEIDDYTSLVWSQRINTTGTYSLYMDGNDPVVDLFELDGQLEIYRSDDENELDWYLEFAGLHRTPLRQTFENGRKQFTSFGRSYNDLLRRRIIYYYAGTTYATKSGNGETVIKAYVDENAGPSATSPPRIVSGAMSGFSVEADGGLGSAWNGGRSFRNLLAVCQEIANDTGIDFDVVGVGNGLFEFRTYLGQLGADRTKENTDGNAPVIFALDFGNMERASYSLSRTEEANTIVVLGRGLNDERDIVEVSDAIAVADSPWNRVESSYNAAGQVTNDELQAVGQKALTSKAARETFSFNPQGVPSTVYGRDYFFGDLITARYDEIERDKKIVGVDGSINQEGKERISVILADVLN